ncbi:energy transducer TonB [Flammeovirga sp. EKP202]|uniref:energy transducer TonB n=1 Tax=Flammeovirga sp. EKP202 TaxID=2770592 RepID=UPI00165ECD67|nr:energy transducer TonB [Flammeovirga sp. EKP202]MBD0401981.1 TonB family protein [Flammeovirga sp. EKP202]
MKKSFILFSIALSILLLESCQPKEMNAKSEEEKDSFIYSGILPKFYHENDISLSEFVKRELKYPKAKGCIEVKVYVRFLVDKYGQTSEFEVVRGISEEADKNAIEVVRKMTFKAGIENGKAVDSRIVVPIAFEL